MNAVDVVTGLRSQVARITALFLMALVAITVASPAAAIRTIVYDGQIDMRSVAMGNVHGELLNGRYDYRAIFRYDDALAMTSGQIIVGGATQTNYDCGAQNVQCLGSFYLSPIICGCTPEDYVAFDLTINSSPVSFDLLGPGHQIYWVSAPDTSRAVIWWTVYWQPGPNGGWAYNEGDGFITRVESYVPEPASWAFLVGGFAAIGLQLRRRRDLTSPRPA